MSSDITVFRGARGFSAYYDQAEVYRPGIYDPDKDNNVAIKLFHDGEFVASVRIDKDLLIKITEDAKKVMEVPR